MPTVAARELLFDLDSIGQTTTNFWPLKTGRELAPICSVSISRRFDGSRASHSKRPMSCPCSADKISKHNWELRQLHWSLLNQSDFSGHVHPSPQAEEDL